MYISRSPLYIYILSFVNACALLMSLGTVYLYIYKLYFTCSYMWVFTFYFTHKYVHQISKQEWLNTAILFM